MRWDGALPADLVELIWRKPRALLARGELLQDKSRCTVARIDHLGGQYVWKHHNWGSWQRAIGRILSPSVSRKSWDDSTFLHRAGVPTPCPRAFLERRLGPFQWSSYLLTDYVVGISLYRLMRYVRPTAEYVQHLARQVADIWQQLDELCVWHNDFKTENLLVDPASNVWLIDFEKMRRFRDRQSARRRQASDAERLLHARNWRATPWAAELFRQEILKTPAAIETLAGPLGTGHPLTRPVPTINQPSQLVTVMIPCRNAADTIEETIESVRDMADEILVADAGSADETIARVHRLGGCRIVQLYTDDRIAFETWANGQASHSWILRLLPNERVDAELSKQVQDTLAAEPNADGFHIIRVVCCDSRRVRRGGSDREKLIRLYRKQAARFLMRAGQIEVSLRSNRIDRLSGYVICDLSQTNPEPAEGIRRSWAFASTADKPHRLRRAA
jgi:hypothetical protein